MDGAKEHRFTARIQAGSQGGQYVDIPFDVEREFGRKRVPIIATIDGESYRGSLVRMGGECHMLLIRKEIRERIGKTVGDEVEITLAEDTLPREVAVPADLAAALQAAPAANAFFEQLSFTHRREYVSWITEAKKAETRQRRVAKTVELLLEGRRER